MVQRYAGDVLIEAQTDLDWCADPSELERALIRLPIAQAQSHELTDAVAPMLESNDHTAYHEAGHAIAAWKLGVRLHKINLGHKLVEGSRWLIKGRIEGETRYSHSDDVRANAIICLAGGEAQKVFAPGTYLGDDRDVSEAKNHVTELLSSPHTIHEMDALLAVLRQDAAVIVSQHKLHIERVAQALLEAPSNCLTAETVTALLESIPKE